MRSAEEFPAPGVNYHHMSPAIHTENLSRIFRTRGKDEKHDIKALDSINIQISGGELFGLLGPNGAGKTTLIKIFSTLLLPSSGKAWVGGFEVDKEEKSIRKIINMVSGGEYSGYGILTVRENLWLFSQFYNVDRKTAFSRIDELLHVVGLEEKTHTRVNELSTGMRQKLNFARGFINAPRILFLDEPTLGLDVGTARDLRSYIRRWLREDTERTVLLTTHYMSEADELCDRIAIINNGKIAACDTSENLKKNLSHASTFEIEVAHFTNGHEDLSNIPHVKGFSSIQGGDGTSQTLKFILENDYPLEKIFSVLIHGNASILSVRKTDKTLEDIFLALCGRSLQD